MKTFLLGTIEIKGVQLQNLPTHVQIWSYIIVFAPILCIPAYAIFKIMISPGRDFDEVNFQEKINDILSFEFSFLAIESGNDT